MGCDIHAFVEFQKYPDERERGWRTFAALQSEPRWYLLFGALTRGEVRGYHGFPENGPPLRGIPAHVGDETGDDYYKDHDPRMGPDLDWHSPSWVTADEFATCLEWVAEHGEKPDYWPAVLATMRTLDQEGTPSRLVFWFDN